MWQDASQSTGNLYAWRQWLFWSEWASSCAGRCVRSLPVVLLYHTWVPLPLTSMEYFFSKVISDLFSVCLLLTPTLNIWPSQDDQQKLGCDLMCVLNPALFPSVASQHQIFLCVCIHFTKILFSFCAVSQTKKPTYLPSTLFLPRRCLISSQLPAVSSYPDRFQIMFYSCKL